MVNIQIIGLSEDEYLELKGYMRRSKTGSWKNFFIMVVSEWTQQQKQ